MILEEARIGERAFSSPLSDLEIDVFFSLSSEEVASIRERRGKLNRLGLALHGKRPFTPYSSKAATHQSC